MTNTVGESTVGFFRQLFSPLESRFKKMDTLMQNRVALPVMLAGFARRAADNDLLPKLLPALGPSISLATKNQIVTELAIGVVSCVRIPGGPALTDVWGLDGEALRQIIAALVFSESADSRQVLESARYSSNPDEARVQVLLSIVRLIASNDDTLITRINTQTFGKIWNGFATEFIDGAVTGFRRSQRSAVIESVAGKLESLSPRGKALIEEFVKRCIDTPVKAKPDPSRLLAPNSRAQLLYNSSRKKAEELRSQITPMMGLPSIDIPGLQKLNEGMQSHWMSICIPYVANLLFLSQIKKDAYFPKSDEFTVIYGQSVLLMASLKKEQAVLMGVSEEFDPKKAQATAQQEMVEMEEAMLFYIDFFKKVPFPDQKMLEFLMIKVGVPENLRSQFSVKLREFNANALADFANL
jgi:hypothetical protein